MNCNRVRGSQWCRCNGPTRLQDGSPQPVLCQALWSPNCSEREVGRLVLKWQDCVRLIVGVRGYDVPRARSAGLYSCRLCPGRCHGSQRSRLKSASTSRRLSVRRYGPDAGAGSVIAKAETARLETDASPTSQEDCLITLILTSLLRVRTSNPLAALQRQYR
jgi:hypothetical protein